MLTFSIFDLGICTAHHKTLTVFVIWLRITHFLLLIRLRVLMTHNNQFYPCLVCMLHINNNKCSPFLTHICLYLELYEKLVQNGAKFAKSRKKLANN